MKLFFRKLGKGRPIIILHGFLGTSDNWITVARKLGDQFEIYLVDQRNHGLSGKSEDLSLTLLAEDLHELVQSEGILNPILIGHSMGGKVVMKYASMYKDSFDKLVIVDIAPKEYPPHHQVIFDGLNSIDLSTLRSRFEADVQLKKFISDDAIRLFLLKNLDRTKQGFAWKANLPVLEKNQGSVGEAIEGENLTRKPVYFIKGSDSDYVLRGDRKRIRELFPEAHILTIKGSGHWPHAQQPQAFYNTLLHLIE